MWKSDDDDPKFIRKDGGKIGQNATKLNENQLEILRNKMQSELDPEIVKHWYRE